MKQIRWISRTPGMIVLFLLCVTAAYAHEEPAKTLKEKADRRKAREQICTSRIKSLTAWNYTVKNNSISGVKSKTLLQEYDSLGNFIAISAFNNDTLDEKATYTYNKSGDLVSDNDYSSDGTLIEKNTYRYDNEGRVIAGESWNNENILTGNVEWIYYRSNDSIEFRKHKMNRKLEYTITYTYFGNYDDADPMRAIKSDSTGKQILVVDNKYDVNKNIIDKRVCGNDTGSTFTYFYRYDKRGKLSEVRKVLAHEKIEWRRVYEYDNDGNRSGMRSYNGKGDLQLYQKYDYEYY